MSDTTQIVEQAIAKQEAEEAGIDTSKKDDNKGTEDAKDTKDSKKETDAKDDSGSKSKSGEGDKPTGDKSDDKPKSDEGGKGTDDDETEGKYTADDALEIEEPKPNDKPEAPTDNAGIQLSQAEQKYIAENIGEPLVIRGYRGTGDDAKEVEIKAYSPADIPSDFKFANDQQLVAAQTGFQRLEQKAGQLLGQFRQNQTTTEAQDFERRENEGIRADVADLQKEGRFPKFRVQPGAQGFDETPEAKQMAEVLNIMAEKNEAYFKQYQQGRPYKHIGFAEAFDIWESKNPERQERKAKDESQKKEDEERKQGAERGDSANKGMSPYQIHKPTVKSGVSTRDLLARIDSMD